MTNQLTVSEQSLSRQAFFANPKNKAIAALLFAAVVISFVPILVKFAENEISPKAIIFHRLWIAGAILGLGQAFMRKRSELLPEQPSPVNPYSSRQIGLLLLTGVFFAAQQILWAFSVTQTSLANSSLLHNFTPLFVAVIGFLLFGQRFDRKFILGMIIAISGSVILGLDDLLYGTSKVLGDGIALISALFFAIYLILVERVRHHLDAVTTVFYLCIIGTLAILPIICTSKDCIFPSSWGGWLAVVGLAWTVVLGFCSTLYALKWLSSGFVAMVLLIEPILTGIFAWVIFSERLDLYNLLAFPTVMLGIYLATTSELTAKVDTPLSLDTEILKTSQP
ncbi:DMT family transporter [Limnofasciculus baicalensis]|uniref:DMT family transporter n=1 Tax=Limnofasciculus baicalensis BBK-W-15 TaxID=2699891 RepID=A0AAE3GNP4_9CYAN|nr:DMT family transporter [Limnofasciculus baicalensis]MCP2726963.1 DMT family transporter [Limnofasciculus baicalensis BBK-W-15]